MRYINVKQRVIRSNGHYNEKSTDKLNLQSNSYVSVIEKRVLFILLAVLSIPLWPLILTIMNLRDPTSTPQTHGIIVTMLAWLGFGRLLPENQPWIGELLHNLFGYGTVFIPIYLISRYLHRIKYDEISKSNKISQLLTNCLFDRNLGLPVVTQHEEKSRDRSSFISFYWSRFCNPIQGSVGYMVLLLFSGIGLQLSYLTWGVLQERIMTQKYGTDKFKDSQFLVFFNRLLAAILASIIVNLQKNSSSKSSSNNTTGKIQSAPYFKYSYASLSNILSSWCQYEALKYVSFPIQVLAKASKIIPVMLMGKLIRRQSYRWDEYLSALTISFGVFLFLLDTSNNNGHKSNSSIASHFTDFSSSSQLVSGVFLLFGYMLFDAFTSNWQDRLFKTYKISPLQMMVGVNIWSCLFTLSSLLESGGLQKALKFAFEHQQFIIDAGLLSLCGAVGQLFIFFTINKFGAVVFIVIMTLRQAIAILLSIVLYGHPVNLVGIVGIVVVFLALFIRIFLSYKSKK